MIGRKYKREFSCDEAPENELKPAVTEKTKEYSEKATEVPNYVATNDGFLAQLEATERADTYSLRRLFLRYCKVKILHFNYHTKHPIMLEKFF